MRHKIEEVFRATRKPCSTYYVEIIERLSSRNKCDVEEFFKALDMGGVEPLVKEECEHSDFVEITNRMKDMFQHVKKFSESDKSNQFFKPIANSDGSTVSCFAQLVIIAVRASDLGFKEVHHDARSARKFRDNISEDTFNYPIEILVKFQNVLRSAFKEISQEIFVDKKCEGQDQCNITNDKIAVQTTLIQLLCKRWSTFWETIKPQNKTTWPEDSFVKMAVKMSLLIAEALEFAHRNQDFMSGNNSEINFIQNFEKLSPNCDESVGTALVISFEYGSYFFSEDEGGWEWAQSIACVIRKKILLEAKDADFISVSFGCYDSNSELKEITKKLLKIKKTSEKKLLELIVRNKDESILSGPDIEEYYDIRLPKIDNFKCWLKGVYNNGASVDIEKNYKFPKRLDKDTLWDLIKTCLDIYRNSNRCNRFGGQDYLPYPYVDLIMKKLAKLYPEFLIGMTLKWTSNRPGNNDLSQVSNIYLPVNTQGLVNKLKNNNTWDFESVYLILARYAAVACLNIRMLLGPGDFSLQFFHIHSKSRVNKTTCKNWKLAIELVEEVNHHKTLMTYLDQLSSEIHYMAHDSSVIDAMKVDDNCQLGIDIGAGTIKWVYKINGELVDSDKIPTDPGDNHPYKSGQDFVERIFVSINKQLAEKKIVYQNPGVIGVAWPGPIGGNDRRYVAAASGIFKYFKNLSQMIPDNNIADIHNLRIQENFQKIFKCVNVHLMNDGFAHQASIFKSASLSVVNGRVLAIVAGTGTAMFVTDYDKSDQKSPFKAVPWLTEAGKIIINLACEFSEKGNFPTGCCNAAFSGKTMPIVASDIVGNNDIEVTNRDIRILEQNRSVDDDKLKVQDEEYINELKEKLNFGFEWAKTPSDEENKILENIINLKIKKIRRTDLKDNVDEIFKSTGNLLSDILAMCSSFLSVQQFLISGGPLSDTEIRKRIESEAKEGLEFYGFFIKKGHHSIHPLNFIAPDKSALSPAEGALEAAVEYFNKLKVSKTNG